MEVLQIQLQGTLQLTVDKKAISDNLHMEVVQEKQIVSGNGFGFDDGRDNFIQLMKQFPDLTAIFCASDEMAIGAISAAYRLGINIPEDVSIMDMII